MSSSFILFLIPKHLNSTHTLSLSLSLSLSLHRRRQIGVTQISEDFLQLQWGRVVRCRFGLFSLLSLFSQLDLHFPSQIERAQPRPDPTLLHLLRFPVKFRLRFFCSTLVQTRILLDFLVFPAARCHLHLEARILKIGVPDELS